MIQVTRPYIAFILSLVISDAFAAFLLGFQLLCGSYLYVVQGILINVCILLASEALKLVGIIVTVLHLLIMVSIHLAGVVNPVKFKEYLTLRTARVIILLLWFVPLFGILLTFFAIPGQGFRSDGCTSYSFLAAMPFRAAYSTLIIVPTAIILLLYLRFHTLLWRRRDVSKSSISRQNIRAARVTFLIILTCTCGWLPAVVNHLIVCESGCRYKPRDFSADHLFIMHAVGYVLVILKSFSNPLIFAFRQSNIQQALIRLHLFVCCCCKLGYAEKALHKRAASTYSSFTRSSTNRIRTDSTRLDRSSLRKVSRAASTRHHHQHQHQNSLITTTAVVQNANNHHPRDDLETSMMANNNNNSLFE